MASKPRRDTTILALQQLLDHYLDTAKAIRTTLTLLQADYQATAKPRAGTVLDQALALDAQRSAGHTNGNGGPPHQKTTRPYARTGGYTKAKAQRRANTAKLLATYDATVPQPAKGKGHVGVLVANGFLKRKGDGYVRTAKEFVP